MNCQKKIFLRCYFFLPTLTNLQSNLRVEGILKLRLYLRDKVGHFSHLSVDALCCMQIKFAVFFVVLVKKHKNLRRKNNFTAADVNRIGAATLWSKNSETSQAPPSRLSVCCRSRHEKIEIDHEISLRKISADNFRWLQQRVKFHSSAPLLWVEAHDELNW